jgi:hypothetical protein
MLINITTPYFKFWLKLLPMLRLKGSSLDISAILGLEVLNTLLFSITLLANGLSYLCLMNYSS